eukprot:GSA25T00006270001.1
MRNFEWKESTWQSSLVLRHGKNLVDKIPRAAKTLVGPSPASDFDPTQIAKDVKRDANGFDSAQPEVV